MDILKDDIYYGSEGVVDTLKKFYEKVKKQLALLKTHLFGTFKEEISLYDRFIREKHDPKTIEKIFRETQMETFTKDMLYTLIDTHANVLVYICTEIEKIKRDSAYRAKNTNQESPIYKEAVRRLKEKGAGNGILDDDTDYWDEMQEDTLYNLGYKSLQDFQNVVVLSKNKMNALSRTLETLISTEIKLIPAVVTNTQGESDLGLATTYETIVSELYKLSLRINDCLLEDYRQIVKILKKIYKSSGTESMFLDPGVELFGFGDPKEGDRVFDPVFGRVQYDADMKAWYASEYIEIKKEYATYNGKYAFIGALVNHPLKKYQKVGGCAMRILTSQKGLEAICEQLGNFINEIEQKDHIFGASCDVDALKAGKDARFYFYYLWFCEDAYGVPVCSITVVFNRRVLRIQMDERYRTVAFCAKSPQILSSVSSAGKDTSLNRGLINLDDTTKGIIKSDSVVIGSEGFASFGMQQSYLATMMEMQDLVDGTYDQEDTTLLVNENAPDGVTPVDGTDVDVDVHIDLTPEREAALLKLVTFNSLDDITFYGKEAFQNKTKLAMRVLKDSMLRVYDHISQDQKALLDASQEHVDKAISYTQFNIPERDNYLNELNGLLDTYTKAFVDVKGLLDVIPNTSYRGEHIGCELAYGEEEFTPLQAGEYASKDDLLYVAREMANTKHNVTVSQLEHSVHQLCDKLDDRLTTQQHAYMDKVLQNACMATINLMNHLSHGERMMRSVSRHVYMQTLTGSNN